MTATENTLTFRAVSGIGEIHEGDDLTAIFGAGTDLVDGDVLVVTSKVVSKAEGRVQTGERGAALADETDRVVARRGRTSIVRTHRGLVMAAAGIDASNTATGTIVLLPLDPDASARNLRVALFERFACNVAVLISDTFGRPWRNGQTDVAIGAAGIAVLKDLSGNCDSHGNVLEVTAPAIADELAGAADLVKGKLLGLPAAIVRGLGEIVLPPGQHGSGSHALIREESSDMFGLGSREAVLCAAVADPASLRGFGAAAPAAELVVALATVVADAGAVFTGGDGVRAVVTEADPRALGRVEAWLSAVAFAHGWTQHSTATASSRSTEFVFGR